MSSACCCENPPPPPNPSPPSFNPSSPYVSYNCRFFASLSTSYASETSLNFFSAAPLSLGFYPTFARSSASTRAVSVEKRSSPSSPSHRASSRAIAAHDALPSASSSGPIPPRPSICSRARALARRASRAPGAISSLISCTPCVSRSRPRLGRCRARRKSLSHRAGSMMIVARETADAGHAAARDASTPRAR